MNLAFNGNKPFDVETRHALSLPKKLDSRVKVLTEPNVKSSLHSVLILRTGIILFREIRFATFQKQLLHITIGPEMYGLYNTNWLYSMKNIKQFKSLETDLITELSYLGLIKITGSNAQQFLQGQLTNDINQVTAEQHQLSALCNHKGRILVSFRVFKRDEAFYLLLLQESVALTLKRLQMYILRSIVQLEDVSDNLIRIGISGANSQKIVTDCLFAPPTEIDTSITNNAITILRIAGAVPRYIIISETMISNCFTSAKVDQQVWQLLDIMTGLPIIGSATTEEFVPQMINYHNINGVSFNKGCYTGQEIIARVHYLGKLKRQLYLAKIDTNAIPKPGDDLQVDGEKVGKIVNSAPHPAGGFFILASIIIQHVETNDIYWQTNLLQFMDKQNLSQENINL